MRSTRHLRALSWVAVLLGLGGCERHEKAPAPHHDEHAEHHEEGAAHAELGAHLVRVERGMLRDLRVTTQLAESRPAGDTVTALGELRVNEDAYAEIGTPLPARVAKVLAAPGELVKEGQVLAELDTIDPAALSPENRIHLAVYRPQVENLAAEVRYRSYEMPFNSDSSFWSNLGFMARGEFESVEDYRAYIDRLADVTRYFDEQIANMRAGLARGFTIIPVPPEIAPFWTAGRGGNNTYWLNTYDLPSRPLYNLPALTLHEASPGHALQGALAEEQDALPDFRRETYISAFGEGWGLYVEKLGEEMGIYETPYQQFGRLTYEMWRACRLVIDTGVHAKGWTRDQALAYLRDHTALSEHEVTTEVDRYISWPGQALSYKLGELAIVRLRGEAERALGDKFDIKAFHDMVLALGSVPLPVLEAQVRAFIAESVAKA